MSALARRKVRIPDDIAIVGFTNSQLTDIFQPSLTSIRQPAFEMGQVAMEMLIQLIESKHPVTKFETRVLNTELTVRASSQKS
ncbi:substrate-binding domain-containing protein [Puia sp. P3]|uniref:substrate-binding domain-containing protein n=1 Tax=Puia sp. P3 TaxID=3423952 RepID=UPI003D67D30A